MLTACQAAHLIELAEEEIRRFNGSQKKVDGTIMRGSFLQRFRNKSEYGGRNKRIATERGYVLLMALMVLLVLIVLGTAIIEVGVMEFKISHYGYITQQAQQGADAGVDWTMENIYRELRQEKYANSNLLPASLFLGNPATMQVGAQLCSISNGSIILEEQTSQLGTNSCTYQYTSTATFAGASKTVQVQVVYTFSGGYSYNDDKGNYIFVPRTSFSHGKIKSYLTVLLI